MIPFFIFSFVHDMLFKKEKQQDKQAGQVISIPERSRRIIRMAEKWDWLKRELENMPGKVSCW